VHGCSPRTSGARNAALEEERLGARSLRRQVTTPLALVITPHDERAELPVVDFHETA